MDPEIQAFTRRWSTQRIRPQDIKTLEAFGRRSRDAVAGQTSPPSVPKRPPETIASQVLQEPFVKPDAGLWRYLLPDFSSNHLVAIVDWVQHPPLQQQYLRKLSVRFAPSRSVSYYLKRELALQICINLLRGFQRFLPPLYLGSSLLIPQDLVNWTFLVCISMSKHRTIGNPATGASLVATGSLQPDHWVVVFVIDILANFVPIALIHIACQSSIAPGELRLEKKFPLPAAREEIFMENDVLAHLAIFLVQILTVFALTLISFTSGNYMAKWKVPLFNAAVQIFMNKVQSIFLRGTTNPAYVVAIYLHYRVFNYQLITFCVSQIAGAVLAGLYYNVLVGRSQVHILPTNKSKEKAT